jgi:protein involved in polysaccharide export with SLBB domain
MKIMVISMKILKLSVILVILGPIVFGCASTHPAATFEQLAADPPPKETLVPGDVVDVKFYYTPELNENQMIRPDGTITMQLIGKVVAQGKTPQELRSDLIRLYGPELKKPEVEVIVKNKEDRKVYVGGEVKNPGKVPMPGELTALDAIKNAGGFKRPEANLRKVMLIRQENGKNVGCVIDMEKVLSGGEEQVVYLHPNDVIYVPPTGVTKLNDKIDQFVSRMIPRPGGFSAGMTFGGP